MTTTAENLRELHALLQRSKALRERLISGPKTLAARQTALAKRRADADTAREALKKAKADIKNKEVQVKALRDRTDELRVRLNTIKKQAEYDALRSEIAHHNLSASRTEDEILELMSKVETQESELKATDAEIAKHASEVDALARDIEEKAQAARTQLEEIDQAVSAAEEIIPAEVRDQYRRVIKQRGADAMAQVEDGSCHGCFVSVTSQMVNELINAETLVFCKTCGRVLYLAEENQPNLKRVTR
jgi:predicted  nucleic acid-binding Zn-ribbon protein